MKKNRNIRVCLMGTMLCVAPMISLSQDMHFSQFLEAPASLNPALTGAINDMRVGLNYKDQWRSVTVPYQTFGGSFEKRFNTNEWEKVPSHTEVYKLATKRISGGVSFFTDKAGDGSMGLTQLQLSVASSLPLSSKSTLGLGLQGGYSQRSVSLSKLIFPEQYTGSGYDPSLSNGENMSSAVFHYADFSGGVLYSFKKDESKMNSNDQLRFNLGSSVYHFSKPGQSFLGNGDRLYTRYTIHAQLEKGFKNTNVSILPALMLNFQGPSREVIVGGMVKYQLKDDTKYTGYIRGANLLLGGYYRNHDAVIATMLLEFGNYGIGFSYDSNISPLHTASNYRGGFEVMLKYVTPNPFLYQNRPRI